jgi:hypothetical protein
MSYSQFLCIQSAVMATWFWLNKNNFQHLVSVSATQKVILCVSTYLSLVSAMLFTIFSISSAQPPGCRHIRKYSQRNCPKEGFRDQFSQPLSCVRNTLFNITCTDSTLWISKCGLWEVLSKGFYGTILPSAFQIHLTRELNLPSCKEPS